MRKAAGGKKRRNAGIRSEEGRSGALRFKWCSSDTVAAVFGAFFVAVLLLSWRLFSMQQERRSFTAKRPTGIPKGAQPLPEEGWEQPHSTPGPFAWARQAKHGSTPPHLALANGRSCGVQLLRGTRLFAGAGQSGCCENQFRMNCSSLAAGSNQSDAGHTCNGMRHIDGLVPLLRDRRVLVSGDSSSAQVCDAVRMALLSRGHRESRDETHEWIVPQDGGEPRLKDLRVRVKAERDESGDLRQKCKATFAHGDVPSTCSVFKSSVFKFKSLNASLHCVHASRPILPHSSESAILASSVPWSWLKRAMDRSDVVLLNFGADYKLSDRALFSQDLLAMAPGIAAHPNALFALTLPHHYTFSTVQMEMETEQEKAAEGGGRVGECRRDAVGRHHSDVWAREILGKTSIPMLDLYPAFQRFGAYHKVRGRDADCLRYCYDLNMWNVFWHGWRVALLGISQSNGARVDRVFSVPEVPFLSDVPAEEDASETLQPHGILTYKNTKGRGSVASAGFHSAGAR
mmetsp:Transcript_62315/g.148456  ORF Transcript_62315/g.148456 Transcript_62315/m.148456 type:complete len:515 (-) Transcript_62315:55-1599(-)